MTPVWLFALVFSASPNPALDAAEDLVDQVRYAEAEKSLLVARALQRNRRETLLRILELQGIVAATLGQDPNARTFFQQLLALDPTRKLPEGLPPRVRTPFFEAKGTASEAAPMIFSAVTEITEAGLVLRAKLSADPLGLARKARFHVRQEGSRWKATDRALAEKTAAVVPREGRFYWWVELLGEHDASLFSFGSASECFFGVQPLALAGTPSESAEVDEPEPEPEPTEPEVVKPVRPASSVSPAAWLCFGGAGAALGGGIVAGVASRSTHGQVDNVEKNADGFVEVMTQREASGLKDQARTQAIIANVLFGSAVALAGAGALIWIFSGPSKVAVVPASDGVALVGAF